MPESNVTRNDVTRNGAPMSNAERQRLYRQRKKATTPDTVSTTKSQKPKKGKPLHEKTPIEIEAHQAAVAPLKRKVGAPSTYDPAIAEELCQRITLREPLERICQDPRMPCVTTVYSWRVKHPEFAAAYAHARVQRAETRADRIDSYMEDLKAGKLDAHTCRVLIDGEKWQASKEAPGQYGDRIDVTSAGERLPQVDASAAISALLAALPSLAPAALPAPQVLDAEATEVPAPLADEEGL